MIDVNYFLQWGVTSVALLSLITIIEVVVNVKALKALGKGKTR